MEEVADMKRTGRPKSDNPKKETVALRLTQEERKELEEYAATHNMSITQVLKAGVKEVLKKAD